ncbi:MAG: hypothetical protein Q9207_007839 [Kuettlingeria erythrocarpa]
MLFTWDTTDLCIIFPQWHVHSTSSLLMSLIGVIILTAGYECVRDMSRRFEASSAEYMNKLPSKAFHSPIAQYAVLWRTGMARAKIMFFEKPTTMT